MIFKVHLPKEHSITDITANIFNRLLVYIFIAILGSIQNKLNTYQDTHVYPDECNLCYMCGNSNQHFLTLSYLLLHQNGLCFCTSKSYHNLLLLMDKQSYNNGNTCVKGPCMSESLCTTMSCKSVFWDTEWLDSLCVNWPMCQVKLL